jgi:DNA polymerase elongation subunit (family B)
LKRENEEKEKEKGEGSLEHAMIITSRARIILFTALEEVLARGGRILYCDTDSVFYTDGDEKF